MASIRSFLVPIYLPTTLLASAVFAVLPGLPDHLGSIGAPIALVGTIVALRGVGTLIMDLPAGAALARIGSRRIMLAAALLFVAAMALLAAVPLLLPTALGVLAVGAAISGFFLGVQNHLRQSAASRQRGRALSSTGGSLRTGALIGPAIGGAVAGRLGMEWTFALSGALAGVALLIVFLFLRESKSVRDAPRTSHKRGTPNLRVYRELLTRPVAGMYVIGGAIFALMLLRAAREFVLPVWGGHIGLGVEVIGYVMSAGALFDLLLFVPAGFIMDRRGRKVAASLCMGLFSIGLALLPLTNGIGSFAAVAVLIGLGNGLGAGINLTLGSDLAPPERAGHFLGLWRLFGDIGVTLGPNLVGAIAAVVALPAAIVAVAAVGAVGTAVMFFAAPETGGPGAERPSSTERGSRDGRESD